MMRSIIAILAVALSAGLFFFYTKPAYDTVRSLQAEMREYDLALTKASELQRLKQSLLARYNSFNPNDLERLHKLLPDHVDNVRLVLDLDTLASKHGLALQNVIISAPNEEVIGDNVVSTIGPNGQKHDSLTLKFGTRGTYPQFTAFLTDIESSLRIVDLVSLTIDADQSGVGSEPVYRFDMTVRTYWLK